MFGREEGNWSSGAIEQKCLLEKIELIWVNGLSSILFEVFSVSTAQYKSFFIEDNKLKGTINYEKIYWCTTWLFVSTWGEEKKRGIIVLIHGKQQQIWKAVLQHSALLTVTHVMCRQVDEIDFKPLQENLFIIQFCWLLWVSILSLEVVGSCGFVVFSV